MDVRGLHVEWEKAFASICRGDDLLIFTHPGRPEAGIQVPGGTLEPGESPADGALREVAEETGRGDLELVESLGTLSGEWSEVRADACHLIRASSELPDAWEHGEFSYREAIPFSFSWMPLKEAIVALFPEQAHFAELLRRRLSES